MNNPQDQAYAQNYPQQFPQPQGQTCAFPQPQPRMVYCSPAPFQQVNGQRYHTIANGYGRARPYSAGL